MRTTSRKPGTGFDLTGRRDGLSPFRRDGGFTMVELVVVMLVLGVLSAVALPRFVDRTALYERGFHDQVKGMLQYARKIAIVQRRDTCVLLTPTQVQAVYVGGGACSAVSPISEPGGSSAFTVPVPTGVAVSGAALVRFNPQGQPVPNSNLSITLGTMGLSVSRETGYVQ